MLTADHVHCAIGGAELLRDVTLSIVPETYTVLIGPNGAGKTTLLSILAGLRKPNRGQVRFDGQDVYRMPSQTRAQRFAVVRQHERVAMPFTAMEVVLMGLYPHQSRFAGVDDGALAHVRAWMARTDTLRLADRAVQSLSGGEFQRVMLARAFVQKPQILFLDEAFSEMDVRVRIAMQALLQAEIARGGLTVLAVQHDLSDAYCTAQQVVALANGRVRAAGPLADTLTPALIADVFGLTAEMHPGKGIFLRAPVNEEA